MAHSSSLTAFLLAAGLGTRLAPLTKFIPKPLIPVAGIPLFHFALDFARHFSPKQILMNVSYKRPLFEKACATEKITLSFEQGGPFGTAGALSFTKEKIEGDEILICNTDTLAHLSASDFLQTHREGSSLATILVRPKDQNTRAYSTLFLDEENFVTNISSDSSPKGFFFCGVHLWKKELLEHLPVRLHADIVRDFYLTDLIPKRALKAFIYRDLWGDIGTPSLLGNTQHHFLSNLLDSTFPWMHLLQELYPDAVFNDGLFLATPLPHATLSPPLIIGKGVKAGRGCVLGPFVTVGDGTILEENCVLSQTAILPGSHLKQGTRLSSSFVWGKGYTLPWV